jgi:ubiquinone/menaquinone biosynthesis C-methylase UbiE
VNEGCVFIHWCYKTILNRKRAAPMPDFEAKMIDILNYGALNLAIGIGYTHKIFDIMESLDKPLTAKELSEESGLNLRYIGEWLGVMVTGEILKLQQGKNPEEEDRYFLPPSHASVLTRNAGPNNLGVYAQEIPLLTMSALTGVKNGFSTGQGIPFSAYPNFQKFMSELADAKHEKTLIQDFLPSVDNGALLEQLRKGINVCDIGCGEGVAPRLMAEAFPRSNFTGIDNHEGAIEVAKTTNTKWSNLEFLVRDAAKIKDEPEFYQKFNYVTAFDAIHDQTHPLDALKGIFHMTAPGGLFSMVDIKAGSKHRDNLNHPMGPFLYTVSLMHCMPVGLNDGGMGLGMMWGRQKAIEFLKEAGFNQTEVLDIPKDGFNLHFLCRK